MSDRNDFDRRITDDERNPRLESTEFNQFYSNDKSTLDDICNSFDSANNIRREPQRQANKPSTPPPRKNAKKKKKSPLGKALIAIIAIILVIVIAVSGLINSILGKITYDDKIENQYVSSDELKSEKDITNILLLGVDARIIYGEDAKTSRSDSMMIISIDNKHNCIKTVSFLRDSWVYIPCKDTKQRLNAACQYGGYHAVADTIEYNFGVDIDGYIVVNFRVFQNLVDALGGVKIDEITEKEANEVNNNKLRYGNAKLEAGKDVVLTGKQALAYCRIRKIDTDFMRAYRQRMVIKSIISEVKSQPTSIVSVANSCAEYLETDLTKRELKRLMIPILKCMKTDMVESRVPFDGTWQYARINGSDVITLDTEKNKEMLIDYIYNKSADEILAEEKE